jgi:hypothetical protein
MTAIRNPFRRAAVVTAALAVMFVSAHAQQAERPDPLRIPPDGEPWRIERMADIPRQLKQAIDRHRGCRIDEEVLRDLPLAIFRPARALPMALVPCGAISYYSQAFVFDRGIGREPSLMFFPIAALEGGFTSTEIPGLLSWDPRTSLLVAQRGSDLGGAPIARHTYRHGRSGGGELNGFMLVKVERGTCCFAENSWQVVWEAQPWPEPK